MVLAYPDLLLRRRRSFVLWRPRLTDPRPRLVVGQLVPGNPATLSGEVSHELLQDAEAADLWIRPADECGLRDGEVYHYWFEVACVGPDGQTVMVRCTDPLATTIDWRLVSAPPPPVPPPPFSSAERWPAAVIGYRGGELVDCDPDGNSSDWTDDPGVAHLPPNRRTVYYELPTTWSRRSAEGGVETGVGTFRDVLALVEAESPPATFGGIPALDVGSAYLVDLGITTLELLPIADCWTKREWGYSTMNYFAADYALGFPDGHASPTTNADLARLVTACHRAGIRFGYDAVMGFGQHDPYQRVNCDDFHVEVGTGDPEEDNRRPWGGRLFKYAYRTPGYDPISGEAREIFPARQLMLASFARWMLDGRIDSVRIDSVETVHNWDFVQEFTAYGRELFRGRCAESGMDRQAADDRFLVAGEELSIPLGLVQEGRVDALWNEPFKRGVRCAILGEVDGDARDFEHTVRRVIDCRELGFTAATQVINYVTSHDVEGYRNERLLNLLENNGVGAVEDASRRIKLAFVCLLTAVGIPMIFAGEEFGDRMDLRAEEPTKQTDPVNFDRASDAWRREVLVNTIRLVALRQTALALAGDDNEFIHVDFTDGRRVLAWRRGGPGVDPVVVVANFSPWGTADPLNPGSEYVVPNWPDTPPGRTWREVTQARAVPHEWVGREPLFPWEAKVYTLA